LARTGLIFTGLQEGAQPGGWGLTPPGQTEPGIPYHVPSFWVPVGGAARRERSRGSGACGAGAVRESGSVFVVFSPYLCHCCSCFPSVCCSVKLTLSRPTGFCLFLSILLRTPAGGGAAAWRFCCRRQLKPKQNVIVYFLSSYF